LNPPLPLAVLVAEAVVLVVAAVVVVVDCAEATPMTAPSEARLSAKTAVPLRKLFLFFIWFVLFGFGPPERQIR
jgi:hypothetical protein